MNSFFNNHRLLIWMKLLPILKFTFLSCYLFISSSKANSQIKYIPINLDSNLIIEKIDTFFFNQVRILDNRFDTLKFFTEQTSLMPVRVLTFKNSTSSFIQKYISQVIEKKKRISNTIIIDIQQFRIPNKSFTSIRRSKTGSCLAKVYLRANIFLNVNIFLKKGDSLYQKIATIQKSYRTYRDIENTLIKVFSDLISVIQKSLTNMSSNIQLFDDSGIKFLGSNKTIYNEKNFTNVRKKWADYKINANINIQSNGIYQTFEEFKNNDLVKRSLVLKFNTIDSVFRLDKFSKRNLPYALLFDGRIYIKLFENAYILSQKNENSFSFEVPNSFGNMYILSSIQEGYHGDYDNSILNNGNIFKNLERIISIKKGLKKKIKELKTESDLNNKFLSSFRNCFIDMDTGDIIY